MVDHRLQWNTLDAYTGEELPSLIAKGADANPTEIKAKVLLAQADSLIKLGEFAQAEMLLLDVDVSECSNQLKAYYHWILTQWEWTQGNLLAALAAVNTACEHYFRVGDDVAAWQTLYQLAYQLSQASLFDMAIEVALKAMQIVLDKPHFAREEKVTCYLLGYLYYVTGKITSAKQYFEQAAQGEKASGDLRVRALLGEASCALIAEDWTRALALAEGALQISSLRTMNELMAESLSCASTSLIHLGQFEQASGVLKEILAMPNIRTKTKRKACREFLLVAADIKAKPLITQAAAELHCLRDTFAAHSEQALPEWEDVYEQWALSKFKLTSACATEVLQTCTSFADELVRLQRYALAAEVLRFGSQLLAERKEFASAYNMLARACELSSQASVNKHI